MDAGDWIALIVGIVGAVLGYAGWRKASEANRVAAESNTIARGSKATADHANQIAVDANELAGGANRLAGEANEIARESKALAEDSNRIAVEANDISREANAHAAKAAEVAGESLDHELRRELESKRSDLRFPESAKGSIWFKEQNGQMVIVAIPLHNVGLGTARDISPEAFINEAKVPVEGDPISSLKHDERKPEAFWLRLILDDTWNPPGGKTIRVVLTYGDGTGPRITERCFRLYGSQPSHWTSKQYPCYSSGPL